MDPTIACDLYRHAGKADFPTLLKYLLYSPGFRFTFFLRKASQRKPGSLVWIFYKLFHRRYFYKYGFQIPLTTKIGKGLHIAHFGNVVLHVNASLGENCNLCHGITIGQANRGERKGYPSLGNKVWVGTGAVIVGKIVVGDNVLIAPNSYVNFDVPSNSIVLGNPGKVIPKEDATLGYIESIMDPAPQSSAQVQPKQAAASAHDMILPVSAKALTDPHGNRR
jgi:serine O-acetyltransferase